VPKSLIASLAFSRERAERSAQYGIFLLVLYASLRGIVTALSKPFWYDEIFTLIMARQPTLGMMWSALRRGVDSQPPLFDLLERATRVFPNPEVGFRLPSILGFACVLVCLFVFVRRRSGAVYGLIAAATTMLTFLYVPYAVEARPYSLVAACVALALVAYQRAASVRWVVVMALALTIAENLHYYSVFALIPFASAEAVYSWQSSRIRWRVWIALAIGASPLILLWQLLSRFRAIYGLTFWARPDRGTLLHFYGDFLQISFFWGLAVSIVCGLAVLGILKVAPSEPGEEPSESLLHERVLVFALLAMPVVVFLATKILHGGYTERYALYSVLGISLATGLILPRMGYRTRLLVPAVLLLALAVNEASFWLSRANPPGQLGSPATAAEQMVNSTTYDDLPVVVTNTHEYLQLAYYAPPDLAGRLVSVVDPGAARRYDASDGDDKALALLAGYSRFRVYDFHDFHSAYSSFLLYQDSSEPLGWWPQRLVDDGYVLRVVASAGEDLVYLVTAPEVSGREAGR
jgi:Dolichyl-phosphate-mannose-protein mannosyltransferase